MISAHCVLLQEAELRSWTAFLRRAVDATYNTEIVIDNLHNMIGEPPASRLPPPTSPRHPLCCRRGCQGDGQPRTCSRRRCPRIVRGHRDFLRADPPAPVSREGRSN